MKWDDLLDTPYKLHGRNKSEGFDCYGLVIECCKRNGTPLVDFDSDEMLASEAAALARKGANIKPCDKLKAGKIVLMDYEGKAHLGYAVSRDNILHTTEDGVKCVWAGAVKIRYIYEVVKK